MRLLLINPKFPESFWSFKWALDTVLREQKAVTPPLGLATLAALCPSDWEVRIVDENVESVPLDPRADLIGICGMGVQFPRQRELLTFYRDKGYPVVAGGSFASLCPERYQALADTVVAGEAEYIWPAFCRDFVAGTPKPLYQETGVVSLSDTPPPRFDLLDLRAYQSVTLQFSRGCPFRCEFCDIIVMFGRRPRTKALEQVGRELDLLREQQVRNVFFVDDNLIGDKPAAKKLLAFLASYQEEHGYRFEFGTEASLNLAQDEELLALFRRANFKWVFIGIESPDVESLKETKKFQNTREDILPAVRRVYASGLDVLGGFIVGFDHDTLDTFEQQFQFVTQSGIQAAMIGLLTAAPKTPLYQRLEREGRLIPDANDSDNTKLSTNIIPKQMGYSEMIEAYRALYGRLLSNRGIAARIRNKVRYLKNPVGGSDEPLRHRLAKLKRTLVHGILPGGVARIAHFLRTLPYLRPRLLPLVVEDWVVGLSMRDYVERHLSTEVGRVSARARAYLAAIQHALRRHVERGAVEVSLAEVRNAAANLSVHVKGLLDRRFFDQAGRYLEAVLKRTTASITLRIDTLHESQVQQLRRLLARLARHGDRVSIALRGELRSLIEVDSSVFNLVLEGAGSRE